MVLLDFLVAFLVSGVLFGLDLLISPLISRKVKVELFILPLLSIVLCIFLYIFTPISITLLNVRGLLFWKNWGIVTITVIIVTFLVNIFNRHQEKKTVKEKIYSALDGMLMEIPQRLFMQVLLFVLLKVQNYNNAEIISIVLNALLWCTCIFVQAIILKQDIDKILLIEIIASFAFSIGVGFVFLDSGCIIFAFLAHGIERVISELVGDIKFSRKYA